MRFLFSLEFISIPSPLYTRTHSTSSLRFRSSSRHQLKQSTYSELPSSHLVPFSVFHPLATVYSSSGLVSLFHPTAASKIRFSRVFPAIKSARLIALPCPHDVSEVHLLQSCPYSADFLRPIYKALLLIAIRNNIDGVSTDTARSLLKLSTPPGFIPEYFDDAYTPPPLMSLAAGSSQ
jgi:hypothetical protein